MHLPQLLMASWVTGYSDIEIKPRRQGIFLMLELG